MMPDFEFVRHDVKRIRLTLVIGGRAIRYAFIIQYLKEEIVRVGEGSELPANITDLTVFYKENAKERFFGETQSSKKDGANERRQAAVGRRGMLRIWAL
jgi:hypothetical protein